MSCCSHHMASPFDYSRWDELDYGDTTESDPERIVTLSQGGKDIKTFRTQKGKSFSVSKDGVRTAEDEEREQAERPAGITFTPAGSGAAANAKAGAAAAADDKAQPEVEAEADLAGGGKTPSDDKPAAEARLGKIKAAVKAAARTNSERRVDPFEDDDTPYSLEEFASVYGGSVEKPPTEWLLAETREDPRDEGKGEGERSLLSFIEHYGGSVEDPPEAWVLAAKTKGKGAAEQRPDEGNAAAEQRTDPLNVKPAGIDAYKALMEQRLTPVLKDMVRADALLHVRAPFPHTHTLSSVGRRSSNRANSTPPPRSRKY